MKKQTCFVLLIIILSTLHSGVSDAKAHIEEEKKWRPKYRIDVRVGYVPGYIGKKDLHPYREGPVIVHMKDIDFAAFEQFTIEFPILKRLSLDLSSSIGQAFNLNLDGYYRQWFLTFTLCGGLKFYPIITRHFDLWAELKGGFYRFSNNGGGIGTTVGLDWKVGRRFAIGPTASYERIILSGKDANLLTAGLGMRF